MPKRHIIPLFIPHAGCPQMCVFCDQRRITGIDTPVTAEQVTNTIRRGLCAAGAGCEVAFYGGSFTALRPATQEALLGAVRPFLRTGAVGSVRLSTRPDAVDRVVCARLRDWGVSTVELGVQSMDRKVLALSRRGHSPEDTVRAAALLQEWGFSTVLQMMTGLPGDSGPESLETARAMIALRPDGVRIYPTVVLRDTELARQMEAGSYRPQTVEEAVSLCAEIYEQFLAAGIPVIRLGLNPTEDLSGGAVIGGAYHPALGELVLSEMYLRRARALLRTETPPAQAVLAVHPKRVSVMVGWRRRNLEQLRSEFSLESLKVVPTGGALWEITLERQ